MQWRIDGYDMESGGGLAGIRSCCRQGAFDSWNAEGGGNRTAGELTARAIGQLERYAVENRWAWYGIWRRPARTLEFLGKEMMELECLGTRDVWTGELDITGCLKVR